ncbi:Mitochondrial fission process protein 1 [Tolypocladium ophioglossoides CBS 100239]|uniref:Mitochondrial fission process protein 1 n=1 Tax=Tolypocladium ophioglossoides (strain CBS 100239) TaxID=1163406 RepID=A0A0L0N7F8_TOLOC|nr:Mitochondrial fission process protein 1 [Tolypocladium ophioglossoides CBS 100239]
MPWWGKSKESKPEQDQEPNASSQSSSFDPHKLPSRGRLPKGTQKIVDKADDDSGFFDDLREGYVPPSTESNLRYAAYATRFRTILLSAHRYVAYTSDIGESFRPVAHPNLVRTAYGISWAYILGDVSYEGYKAYWHNQRILNPQLQLTPHQEKVTGLPASETRVVQPGVVSPLEDWRTVMVQRGIFQSMASMGLPAFTIHSVVRYSGRAMKNVKNVAIRTWTPIGLGLAVVPFLPVVFDKPVEEVVEWVFHKGFETFGGKQYVGDAPTTGRENLLNKRPKTKGE